MTAPANLYIDTNRANQDPPTTKHSSDESTTDSPRASTGASSHEQDTHPPSTPRFAADYSATTSPDEWFAVIVDILNTTDSHLTHLVSTTSRLPTSLRLSGPCQHHIHAIKVVFVKIQSDSAAIADGLVTPRRLERFSHDLSSSYDLALHHVDLLRKNIGQLDYVSFLTLHQRQVVRDLSELQLGVTNSRTYFQDRLTQFRGNLEAFLRDIERVD